LFLVLTAWVGSGVAAGAPGVLSRPAPHFVAGGKADQDEGRRALQEFRAAGLAGTYWLEFELRVMPRKGDERTVTGQILGTRGEQGPVTRLETGGQRWLIQSGPHPAAWTNAGPGARALTEAESLQPLAGTDLSVFDLQMPFLYWDDFVYEGLANIRGRPAYSLILYPPADVATGSPALAAVRVELDTQFHALVQAEMLGAGGEAYKSITVLDLKKAEGQWIVKEIDLRNLVTRDKTRFQVKAVALNLAVAPEAFTPEALAMPLPAPDAAKVERF
jgi:hypothetical protein